MANFAFSEDYTKLAQDVITKYPDRFAHLKDVQIGGMASDAEKSSGGRLVLGECIRAKDVYRDFCPYDFLIVIYEPNCQGLTEDQMHILIYHELLHIGVEEGRDGEPKYSIVPHDAEEFREVIQMFGIDWAERKEA